MLFLSSYLKFHHIVRSVRSPRGQKALSHVVFAEVAAAGAEGGQDLGQSLEATVGLVGGWARGCTSHPAGADRGRRTPHEELTGGEALVDAVVAALGRGDLGTVVERAVTAVNRGDIT